MTDGDRPDRDERRAELPEEAVDDLAAIQESGKALLNNFYICIRMAGLYDASNAAFKKPMKSLKVRLDRYFGENMDMKVMFAEGQIYINDVRLKTDAAGFDWVEGLTDFFMKRDIGGFSINSPPRPEALDGFLQLIIKTPFKKAGDEEPSPRELLAKALAKHGISEFSVLKPMELAEEDERMDTGREVILLDSVSSYISGIMSYKSFAMAKGGSAQLIQMTRTVQQLADAADEVGGDLMALVTIKNVEHVLLSHAMNVCVLSMMMGKMLPLSKAQICDLAIGALMHDIGKVVLKDEEIPYQRHPYESYRVIMNQGEFDTSLLLRGLIALDHHVSYDGVKGFPQFRLGQRPHMFARIVAIADAFDCLTTPAGGDKPMLPDIALRSIMKNAGTIFDPVLANLFAETIGRYPVGTLVETDSGDLGIVLKSGRGASRMLRPIVLIVKDRYGKDVPGGFVIDMSEKHQQRKAFLHSIVCSHDPEQLGINVSGFLLDFLAGRSQQIADEAGEAPREEG